MAETLKHFFIVSISKEMHKSQGKLSYKQTLKSSKFSNNFTKTI